jgi:hypothetical protein
LKRDYEGECDFEEEVELFQKKKKQEEVELRRNLWKCSQSDKRE